MAAKGNGRPQLHTVQGSYSGTQTTTCDPSTEVIATDAQVVASSLGSGVLHSGIVLGVGSSSTFSFTSANGTLTGVSSVVIGPANTAWLQFVILSGTGKFAGVTGGQLQTNPVTGGPSCETTITVGGSIYGQLFY
jgi:hypothetical protein